MNSNTPPILSKQRGATILVVDSGHGGTHETAEAIANMVGIKVETVSYEMLASATSGKAINAIVFDFGSIDTAELEAISEAKGFYEDVPLIVVSEALSGQRVRQLLKLKISDWLPKPLQEDDLYGALQAALRNAKHTRNQVHAVVPSVGGAGATSVAISLADLLRRELKDPAESVALIDLDFSTGSCGYYLNLQKNFPLNSVLADPSRIDEEFVKLIEQKHDAGFSVYSFNHRGAVTNINAYELVLRLLDAVTIQHSHTVLDIPYFETDWREDVLAGVNTITIVSDITLPAISQSLNILRGLREHGQDLSNTRILLNKHEGSLFSGSRIKKSKLEELFEGTPFFFLPEEKSVLPEAIDRGVLPRDVNSGSKFLKALSKYLDEILVKEPAEAKK